MPPDTAPSAHTRRHQRLSLLPPLLAATEFIENGSFLFAAGRMAQGLGTPAAGFAAVLAAFVTGSMLMIALQQRLVRRFGYRHYLAGALLVFIAGALGSLLAPGLRTLLLARLVQGLGAGALFTSGRILVVPLFAKDDRPAVLKRFILGLFSLSALGPLAAALMLHLAGWRAVFAVPLPLALLSLWGVWAWLPDGLGKAPQGAHHPLGRQWLAVLGLAAALGLLQLSLAEARLPQGLGPQHLLAGAAGALALLGAWAWHQRGHPAPLLQWQGLRHPAYLVGLGLFGLYYLVANANGFVVPVFAEQVLGVPTLAVGLLSSAGAAVSAATAWLYLRYAGRSPQKPRLMAAAAGVMALSCTGLALVPASAGLGALLPAVLAKGVFGALFVLPLAGLTFRDLADEHFGPGYQTKNLLRHLMISAGMSLAALSLVHLEAGSVAVATACREVLAGLALACVMLGGLVLVQRHLR